MAGYSSRDGVYGSYGAGSRFNEYRNRDAAYGSYPATATNEGYELSGAPMGVQTMPPSNVMDPMSSRIAPLGPSNPVSSSGMRSKYGPDGTDLNGVAYRYGEQMFDYNNFMRGSPKKTQVMLLKAFPFLSSHKIL